MTETDLELQNLRRICSELERAHQLNLASISEKDRTIEALRNELSKVKARALEVETENRLQHGQIVRLRRQLEVMEAQAEEE